MLEGVGIVMAASRGVNKMCYNVKNLLEYSGVFWSL